MIRIEHISKTFNIPVRNAGIKEAVKAFFHREYKTIKALDDVNFTIKEGEIVGYIGPNGAGKSSTIKIMSGILMPDEGICEINGIDPFAQRREHAGNIGVVFGQRSQLWWDIPVIDSFELLKDMYEIPEDAYKERLQELVTLLDLETIVRMPTRQLSLGQRMRCEIAASLLHNPKVLFLDEPTIGLDAVSKIAVRQFIKDINQRYKTTIILTTHDMQDIESLVSRILLIGKGKILFDGSMAQLKSRYTLYKYIEIQYTGVLPQQGNYEILEQSDHHAKLRVVKDVSQVLSEITQQVTLEDIEIHGETVDDIILKMYQELKI